MCAGLGFAARGYREPRAGLALVAGAHRPAGAVAVLEQRDGPLARDAGQVLELGDTHRRAAREVRGEFRAQAVELPRGVREFLAHPRETAEECSERLDLGRGGAELRAPRGGL